MRVNTSWAFAGSSVYAGCQWAVLVLLVKSLSQPEVGDFAFGLAVTAPIFVLANVRLRMLLVAARPERSGLGVSTPATLKGSRHTHRGPTLSGLSPDFSDFLAARLMTTLGAAIGSGVIAAIASPAPGAARVIVLIAVARSCDAMSDICHGLFQRELDMRTPSIGLMLNGAASVLLVAVSLALSGSVAAAAVAYAAGSAIALFAWDLPRARRIAPPGAGVLRVRWDVLRGLLAPALPLGLSSAIASVQSNLPRYVVAASLGSAPLAVFAALSQIPMIGHLVVNAASQAALPLFARDAGQRGSSYRARLGGLVVAGAAFGIVLLVAVAIGGAWLLRLLYGAAYAEHISVLLWLTAAAAVTFVSVFLGTAVTASGRFAAQAAISATSLSVVAVSIWPLTSRYGLNGAAVALVGGALVELGAYAFITMRGLRDSEPAPVQMPAVLAGSVQP